MSLQQGFFTNSAQYKNANTANFVLAVALEMNWTNEVWNFENVILLHPLISNFTFTNTMYCKRRRKLQIYGNRKLAIMPKLPICEFVKNRDVVLLFQLI